MAAEGTMSVVAGALHSLMLMSGTLAPVGTTVSELGPTFNKRALPALAAGHVVPRSALRLVSVAQVSSAAGSRLECNFRAWKRQPFQLSVGEALLEVVKAIPAGVLVFFPSYELLERCLQAWQQKPDTPLPAKGSAPAGRRKPRRGPVERVSLEPPPGAEATSSVWSRLLETKGCIVIEPPPLSGPHAGRGGANWLEQQQLGSQAARAYEVAKLRYEEAVRRDGQALLLAVFRGRMSEGVSFDDDYARGVVCIGIPFPNLTEERLAQKRACNDFWVAQGTSPVTGDAWYESKALHAVAQALGRCIRHPRDYGALVLLDSRWSEQGKAASLPQWLQPFLEEQLDAAAAAASLRAHFLELRPSAVKTEPSREEPSRATPQALSEPSTSQQPTATAVADLQAAQPQAFQPVAKAKFVFSRLTKGSQTIDIDLD